MLHAEVFGFNFSADINPYQRSDDCVIASGSDHGETSRCQNGVEEERALAKDLENCSAERACTPCTTLRKQVLASSIQGLGLCVASLMGRFVPVQVGSHGAVLSTPPL